MYSQDFPIPAEGAEWNNAEVEGTTYYANRIVCIGDTLIDSIHYSKLYKTWSAVYFQTGACEFDYSSGPYLMESYEGAVRTDEYQKVYYIFPEEDTSRLIYDFSVNEGDSVKIDGYDAEYYSYILGVDTIFLSNGPRKRITMQGIYSFHDEWIEGVGSIYGLLATFMRPWERYDSELTCYQEYGERLYPSVTNCDRCNIVTVDRVDTFNSNISIYPNPITATSIIEWSNMINASKLIFYNLSGRIILLKEATGAESLKISNQELEKGILLMELIDKDQNLYRKRIIVM